MSVMGPGLTAAQARAQALALLPAGYTSGRLAGDILPAPAVLSRAQAAGAVATAVGPDGVTLVEYAANQPRFAGPLGRLVQEPQQTNPVRNPRGEYPSPPSFPTATPPDFHGYSTGGIGGMTAQIVGTGVELGANYWDVRYFGTAAGIGSLDYRFETPTQIAASSGQTWTASVWWRIVGGDTTRLGNWRAGFFERNSGGGQVATAVGSVAAPTSTIARAVRTVTLAGGVNTAFVLPIIIFDVTGAGAVDITLRLYRPNPVAGPFVGTETAPPVGTRAASTRGDDIITAPLSALRIPGTGECSFLYRGVITALTGQPQTILGLDDGTANNRFALRVSATGIPQVVRATAGSEVIADIGAVAVTPGVPFSCGGGFDGAGRAFGVFQGFNSGTGVAVTGGPTGGLINARVGSSIVAANTMLGEHERWEFGRLASDAAMQARVAAY